MEEDSVDKMDTSSPPGSPAKSEISKKSRNQDTDESSDHSSSENSNGPVENNNEDSSDVKSKTNGVTPEHSQCSESSDSQKKPVDKKQDPVKAKDSLISDSDSKNQTNDEGSDESNEEESSEEGSENGSEDGPENVKETVTVHSDSDPETVDDDSERDVDGSENNDVVMIETQNEVHEIDSDDDDCVVTNEEEPKSVNGGSVDSDIELDEDAEDPLNHSESKAVSVSQQKPDKNHSKDGSSVVIVGTDSILAGNKSVTNLITIQPAKVTSSPSTQSITESLAIRGSTITEVTVKSNNTSPQAQPNNTPLLPTLTDDMFVVEAPSFIVPYVYEKPSVKPFREFVDILGKELDEKRAKDEKEQLEKESEEKERRKKMKEEKRAKGEEVEDSEVEEEEEEVKKLEDKEKDEGTPDSKQKIEKKKGKPKRRNEEDDDASWDGDSDMGSEDEQVSEDDELTTVVIKDKDDHDIDEIKTIAKPITEDSLKPPDGKPESFFDNNLGKFFMNIGINLVQEYVQSDLLRQQKRKLRKENKSQRPHTKEIESAIKYLNQNLGLSKAQNAPYRFKQKYCQFCLFRTESALIMAHHLETPHMKNNIYTCNFCEFEVRSPHDILYHMEAEHNTRSRLERAPAYHQCANCPFEDNGKGKLARHLIACAKKFKPELNLAPPVDWEPPAKIPKLTRARNNLMNTYRGGAPLGRPPSISTPMQTIGRPRGPLSAPNPRGQSIVTGAPLMRGGVMMRPTAPINPLSFPITQTLGKISHQPSISITPLPRTPQPQASSAPSRTQGSFVICEICDGYIKDLEQLRSHMQWIHKVKIHPKMIYNRPPLNCQKCQFRFFTDQGLERHLLGSHGLVTSSMQETANQGKDSGRCPVCGRVYQWKLLNHVAKDHNMTLKPAHLSYKCTVCTATFSMYKQFESHVYSAHSAVGKRMADNTKPPTRVGNSSITIVPAGKAGAKV